MTSASVEKLNSREELLTSDSRYSEPLSKGEKRILDQSAESTVEKVKAGELTASQVLGAFIKQTVRAQRDVNCITEPLFPDAEKWAKDANLQGPLAGFPISLKDPVSVKGYDSTIGYGFRCKKPLQHDSVLVTMLKDAGAIPFVKTNIPTTMLSFECTNSTFGTTENPHLKGYCPGGSSGGESALLAYGGSRIGIGTDVAGSVRLPAHFSGIYSIKCSTQRFPKDGNTTSMPGQDGIPAVYSPMARSLDDLSFFLKTFIGLKPWTYDYSCVNMPWREYQPPAKLKVGVIWTDGVVTPTPACHRALKLAVDALKSKGHTVTDFVVPDGLDALAIASSLLCADGCRLVTDDLLFSEHNDTGVNRGLWFGRLPWILRKVYTLYVRYIRKDHAWAYMLDHFNEKSVYEYWKLIARREAYKSKFFAEFNKSGADILLTVPNATPAFPTGGLYNSWSSCGYTFLFNLLDYSAGILPVTKVDKSKDITPSGFKPENGIEEGAWMNYDAEKMDGLPVGVQVVGRRLEEEKVLACMKLLQGALSENGVTYEQLPVKL